MMVVSSTTMSWAPAMTTRIHQWARVGASPRPVGLLTVSTLVTSQSVGHELDPPSGDRDGQGAGGCAPELPAPTGYMLGI